MHDYQIPDILLRRTGKNLPKLRPVFGKSHTHNVYTSHHETLKTRHIFGLFVCLLALNHFFIEIAMLRAAGDPEELFLPRSLTSCCKVIQRAAQVEAEWDLDHPWPFLSFLSFYPCKLLLVRASDFGGGMVFLSCVGTVSGTALL